MVTQLGFADKEALGQIAWTQGGGQSFLGQSMAQPSDFSSATADKIDNEVKQLVERAYRCVSVGVAVCGGGGKRAVVDYVCVCAHLFHGSLSTAFPLPYCTDACCPAAASLLLPGVPRTC